MTGRLRYTGGVVGGYSARTLWAVVLALGVGIAVLFWGQTSQGAIIAGVGAVAAALVAATDDRRSVAPAPAPAATAPEEALEAIAEPVLLLRSGRVRFANAAAREVLGRHIVGEDARVAIRHPAAADRLLQPEAAGPPLDLVGLGRRDQRWQMRVGTTSTGDRIVHLVDQTGSYAAERMRVDFVANASHELRTPLAAILGFVETLGDEAGEEPGLRRRFLRIIDDEARRMQRLVEDLLSLSRIEAEKYRLPAETLDLAQLVREVCAEIRDGGHGRGADLVTAIADAVPPMRGDRAQLSQLIHNLVGNALKYGQPETPVTITLGRDAGEMVRLSVADRGDGIAPEHLPRLTERFYRVDTGRSRALGGTGLGLAIVKHIVERHGGRFDIASEVGVGTTATVTLPPASHVIKP